MRKKIEKRLDKRWPANNVTLMMAHLGPAEPQHGRLDADAVYKNCKDVYILHVQHCHHHEQPMKEGTTA